VDRTIKRFKQLGIVKNHSISERPVTNEKK